MSGPIETTGLLVVGAVALIAAALVVPLPKPKPEQPPEPPAYERLAGDTEPTDDDAAKVAPVTTPAPPPPAESDDHRIRALEQSVHEIQRDQQELKDEIRALVEEIKTK